MVIALAETSPQSRRLWCGEQPVGNKRGTEDAHEKVNRMHRKESQMAEACILHPQNCSSLSGIIDV